MNAGSGTVEGGPCRDIVLHRRDQRDPSGLDLLKSARCVRSGERPHRALFAEGSVFVDDLASDGDVGLDEGDAAAVGAIEAVEFVDRAVLDRNTEQVVAGQSVVAGTAAQVVGPAPPISSSSPSKPSRMFAVSSPIIVSGPRPP